MVMLLIGVAIGLPLGALALAVVLAVLERDTGRGGYLPPYRGLEAQPFQPPYTGER